MNFLADAVNAGLEVVGLKDEKDEILNTIEDKTGVDAEAVVMGGLSGGVVGGVQAFIQSQDEQLNDKFGGDLKNQYIENSIQLTREDKFNIQCELLNVKNSQNVLLNTFYLLFFDNDTNSESYKVRKHICEMLFKLKYLYLSYAGIIVSPAFALEASSKSIQNFLINMNRFFIEIIDYQIIDYRLINFIRSDLILGSIQASYTPIIFLLTILAGKRTYQNIIRS